VTADGVVSVTLPAGVAGVFEWRGTRRELSGGRSRFRV